MMGGFFGIGRFLGVGRGMGAGGLDAGLGEILAVRTRSMVTSRLWGVSTLGVSHGIFAANKAPWIRTAKTAA